jgi:hypothetical protein
LQEIGLHHFGNRHRRARAGPPSRRSI